MLSNIFLDLDMHLHQSQLLIDVKIMVALNVDEVMILCILRHILLWVNGIAVDSNVRHLEQFDLRALGRVNEVKTQKDSAKVDSRLNISLSGQ